MNMATGMAAFDKPLAYMQNMMQGGAGFTPGDSPEPMRVRVEMKGFPASVRSLSPGNYTIGASPDCDLIIPEAPGDEIALLHVRDSNEPHEIVSLARGITLNGQPFNMQQRVPLLTETALQAGNARIVFTPRVNNMQRAGLLLRKARMPAAPAALLVVAAVLAISAWFSMGSSTPRPINDYNYAARGSSPITSLGASRLNSPEETANELNRLLRAADLADRIVAEAAGNEVLVKGEVDARSEPRMNEILQLVGARSRVSIRSAVRPDTTTLIDSIAGVSLKPSRYIVMRDGDRFRAGDLMPNGWSIESIDDNQVVIVRDGLRETLNLSE